MGNVKRKHIERLKREHLCKRKSDKVTWIRVEKVNKNINDTEGQNGKFLNLGNESIRDPH